MPSEDVNVDVALAVALAVQLQPDKVQREMSVEGARLSV
jgi:hypothetical protein